MSGCEAVGRVGQPWLRARPPRGQRSSPPPPPPTPPPASNPTSHNSGDRGDLPQGSALTHGGGQRGVGLVLQVIGVVGQLKGLRRPTAPMVAAHTTSTGR